MLRSQYGIATSSSVTSTALHAEDVQPNEVIYKRRHGRPPQIGPYKRRHGRPLQIGPNILGETSTIKKEPCTPSPAPSRMERSLITSSCKFYPIPEFCKKTFPGFKENRNAFFQEKMQELTRLGLTKVKSFFRDDGLAIEWKSKVPVWSDTLLPEFPDLASAIKRAHQMNHQTSSPKRKRQSDERHSRDSSLKNIDLEPNGPKLLRCSLENSRIQDSVTPQQNMSAMDVETPPTPIQFPKSTRRMLFKPMLPGRRNRPKISTVPTSTLLTPNSAEPLSSSLSIADGHSKKDELEVTSRVRDIVFLQEKPTSPHPRLPPPSNKCTPTPLPLPPRHHLDVQIVEIPDTGVSPSKDEDFGNTTTDTEPDAEMVVDLLLRGTEEPHDSNCLSIRQEIIKDLPRHRVHDDKDGKDEALVSAVKDTAAVEGLATRFLQQYLQLFDVDRLKLEAAYAKNALFSCRIHHVQEPSFSMAGLFAPESNRGRQGFNVSLSHASISAIEKGRSQIVNRLLELGPHRFCPRGVPRTVDYNVVPLPSSTGGGILLTVHGEVVNPHLAGPQMDHILSVDQNFVLRKRGLEEEEEEDGFEQSISSSTSANDLWPLVAVSHQMTVRDTVPLQEQSDGLISRIQGS